VRTKKRDIEGEILALGFDTESTSSGRMKASRGAFDTGYKSTWEEVLTAVMAERERLKDWEDTAKNWEDV
jgi:hypothetical protein